MSYPTLADIKVYLGVTSSDYDNYLTLALAAAIDAVEKFCGRVFILETVTEKLYNQVSVSFVNLGRPPVTSITSVQVDGTALDASEYKFDQILGQLFFTNSPKSGDFEIEFEGGFDPIPPAVDYTLKESVKSMYNNRDSDPTLGPLKSERIDGAATLAYFAPDGYGSSESGNGAPAIIAAYADLLEPYRLETVFGAFG